MKTIVILLLLIVGWSQGNTISDLRDTVSQQAAQIKLLTVAKPNPKSPQELAQQCAAWWFGNDTITPFALRERMCSKQPSKGKS